MAPHRLTDTEVHVAFLSLRRIRYSSMAACDQNTDRFIRKRVRAKGTRPTADIPVADRDQAPAPAFILQPRFLWARFICLPFEIPTPAPCARRTGRSRTVSLCGKV